MKSAQGRGPRPATEGARARSAGSRGQGGRARVANEAAEGRREAVAEAAGGHPETVPEYALFARLREGLGDRVAVRYGKLAYRYAEVAARARRLADALSAAGTRPGARVLIVLPDTPPFVWSVFGTLACAGVAVMVDPRAPPDELAYVIDYARPEAVIATPDAAAPVARALARAPGLRAMFLVPDVPTGADPEAELAIPAALAAATGAAEALPLSRAAALGASAIARGVGARAAPRPPEPDEPAFWLLTSGSSGRSKAAVHNHRDLVAHAEAYGARTLGLRADDVTLSAPRLCFGYATGTNLLFPFAAGATTCLFSERPTPEILADAAALYRPTVITNLPTMLAKLLDLDDERGERGEERLPLGEERFHISAGEALPPGLLERFQRRFSVPIYDGIGSAETFHIYATNRPGDARPGSLGRAVPGCELAILPEDARDPDAPRLPAGEVGVLWVKGARAAGGYAGDREASERTFFGPWVRTGDLCWLDGDGYLYYRGRADARFKASGVWIEPAEIESLLGSHPAVAEAAVFPFDRGDGLIRPRAIIAPTRGYAARARDPALAAALADELRARVRDNLGAAKQPRRIDFADALPRSGRGKLDRAALREERP